MLKYFLIKLVNDNHRPYFIKELRNVTQTRLRKGKVYR
jgi:hypothetical protein